MTAEEQQAAPETEPTAGDPFGSWASIDLMGHRHLVGYVSDVELFGSRVIRVLPLGPAGEELPARYFSPSALYELAPCTEAEIRAEIDSQRASAERRALLMAPRRPHISEEVQDYYEGGPDEDDDETDETPDTEEDDEVEGETVGRPEAVEVPW